MRAQIYKRVHTGTDNAASQSLIIKQVLEF